MAVKLGARTQIDRRTLLIGGGVGVGLIVAWAAWPRTYLPNLTPAPGEQLFGAWLKIGSDGHVTVAVPQCEEGQGVYTAMPQIVADELGADWKMVGVEPAPLNPLYANQLAAEELFEAALGPVPATLRRSFVRRGGLMLTGGSTSIRNFEDELRHAGGAARVLLQKAAARRWGVNWQDCGTFNGIVYQGSNKLGFGALAEDAAGQSLPDAVPPRVSDAPRLHGQPLPRLDAPSKVDGSANFAADIRLPNMVYASIRQGPIGETSLVRVDRAAADRIPGMLAVVTTEDWVAAVANNWWAADRAIDAMRPRFKTPEAVVNSDTIDDALNAAFGGSGTRMASAGDLSAQFRGAEVVAAEYRVGLALHAALEPMTATAVHRDGRLTLWLPTQAPGLARAAAARAAGLAESDVILHPTMAGGSFGAKLESDVAAQAALLAMRIGRPVQLSWPRGEDFRRDRFRPAAAGRMTARLDAQHRLTGWLAKIAAPESGRELAARLLPGAMLPAAGRALGRGDPGAVAGAVPPYAIPNFAVDHHPAEIGVPSGYWRSGAHSYTCFFTESFLDELAHVAGQDALSFRMAMLGAQPRLARCLQTAAQLGGWQGGQPGSGQGIACHSFRGAHIAVLAEAQLTSDRRVKVERLVAAVDCGRVVNPDLVMQQIEGGLIFGLAGAVGSATGITENVADVRAISELRLPTLADSPDITVELIRNDLEPGGASELAVPPVAPAIANALQAATGVRFRRLPLLSDIE
ncbi:isoquinoline 1-oxidoreductase beta subunit [Sphingomonas naasensis]|uniref:Xanthine dehydrogenase family protein molybdopterin-binding subunit n=1 Tax=Sphingomonas naasensis TaxID=1344951 RepID=A0A4S1WB19_9SPHN|nr:molybdopterin cofactor-binding domain-containing protein [Sphingomonas naasensis]NIJ19875.1 isoquinoline 1-oxidoreductase beta subunit [Sphingomonas naasensis]TGX39999.1 xanthine dehydrogenase family protein molybdopterin-binding subunit [Sphingomonas naasensis]